MSQSLSFFIKCLPPKATAQGKGVCMIGGKPRFFKKAPQKAAEGSLWALLQPWAPVEPFAGPVTLVVNFRFPWRKSEKKSVVNGFRLYPIETKPDVDNLCKMLCDVMTGLRFWNDDSQISSLCIHKDYSDTPGIHINLTRSLATDRRGGIASLL